MSVWIEHPDLPGRPVEVSDLSLPHWRAAGWVVTKAPEKPKKLAIKSPSRVFRDVGAPSTDTETPETPDDAAEGVASDKNETEPPKSRRRASTKED